MSNELKLMPNDWVLRTGIETKVTPNMLLSLEINPAFAGNIQPIKITPKIMDMVEWMEKVEKNSLWVTYKFNNVYIRYTIKSSIFRFDIIGKSLILDHLHQLQQLIRLFTCKEIEVKWEK